MRRKTSKTHRMRKTKRSRIFDFALTVSAFAFTLIGVLGIVHANQASASSGAVQLTDGLVISGNGSGLHGSLKFSGSGLNWSVMATVSTANGQPAANDIPVRLNTHAGIAGKGQLVPGVIKAGDTSTTLGPAKVFCGQVDIARGDEVGNGRNVIGPKVTYGNNCQETPVTTSPPTTAAPTTAPPTTAPPPTAPPTTTATPTTAPPATTPTPTTAPPTQGTQPPQPPLPVTGSPSAPLVAIGVGALLWGIRFVRASLRRRTQPAIAS